MHKPKKIAVPAGKKLEAQGCEVVRAFAAMAARV